jgi:hypothetical protein
MAREEPPGGDPKPDLDERVRWTVEAFSRSVNRRKFLRGAAEAGFALVAGTALGSWQAAIALAAGGGCKDCNYLNGLNCSSVGHTCPNPGGPGSCPSGCTVCLGCDCSNHCCYSAGWWTVTGCGTCGNGTRYCTDCKCSNCANGCTCRSACTCCSCCSPADIADELIRLRREDLERLGISPSLPDRTIMG